VGDLTADSSKSKQELMFVSFVGVFWRVGIFKNFVFKRNLVKLNRATGAHFSVQLSVSHSGPFQNS
jgi:hypothetical protein